MEARWTLSTYWREKKELIGYRQSKVVWSKQRRRWNVVDMLNGDILAYVDQSFPVGTHYWTFTLHRW